jgi:tRNA A37 threonylcarbamoyladenosine biosynthesis protein TsaE
MLIFLKWDLWAGKTTISKHILNDLLAVKEEVRSPTYVYYNKYW